MLRLKRLVGDGFYVMDKDKSIEKPLFEIWVEEIDEDGEFADVAIKGTDNDRTVTLGGEIEVADGLSLHFIGVSLYKKNLSVELGFETKYRVIRHELLNRITKGTIGNGNK